MNQTSVVKSERFVVFRIPRRSAQLYIVPSHGVTLSRFRKQKGAGGTHAAILSGTAGNRKQSGRTTRGEQSP
ncbi:hypothetical protein RRG08_031245 [Elysia crispata]|uniref:Uncharacterized protein n=1 Tax=Elysia crispata TaxID=231223 RepID=A0AAE1AIU3_9GAST|nr:hypothetical protein RRG08_031245 [Elysia crispata]